MVVVVLEPAVHQDQAQSQQHHQQAARHQEQDQLSEQQQMVITLSTSNLPYVLFHIQKVLVMVDHFEFE